MDEAVLEKIGLTKGEAKVYLSLNKLGQSTIGPLVSESRVTKSKIYDILEKLIEKGLAGYIVKEGTKYFMASNPQMIIEYLRRKEEEIRNSVAAVNSILPQLLSQRASAIKHRVAELYEGFQGMKAIREELMSTLRSKETLFVLGAPKIANEKWETWFLSFHKKRVARNIGLKIIYNADARKYGKKREKMRLTEVRYLPNNLVSPNWIDIFPEAVLFVMILEKPLAFVVRNREIADSFRAYFDIMWKNSLQ